MRTVVIYKSRYGATQQYAQWIGEALGADVFGIRQFNKDRFDQYDTVILGGGTYAGNINGLSLISKNFDQLRDKNLVIFTVGMKDPEKDYNRQAIEAGLLKVLTPAMLEKIKVFSFRGALDASKVNVLHYSMLKILVQMVDNQEEYMDRDEIDFFHEALRTPHDFVERGQIKPLVNYVRTLQYMQKQQPGKSASAG